MIRALFLTLLLVLPGLADDRKPNVVLFLIDDLSHFTMTPYGGRFVEIIDQPSSRKSIVMPRIEKLAEQGIRCDHAYTYAICENTRVALMTGMHNGRNLIQPKALHASQITFGDVFQRQGYATGMYGKWKQTRGTPTIPALDYISELGWDDYLCFDVTGEGFRCIEPTLVENGKLTNYHKTGKKDPVTGRRPYGPELCNRAALKFIEKHKDRPFFLYYPMILVHDEHTPTPDTKPESIYDEWDLSKPHGKAKMLGDDRRYLPDMLTYMDKMVGKVIDKLAELDLSDNTLVIFMGDNGTKETFRMTMADGTTHDGGKGGSDRSGEQVGLIFHWPGKVPTGSYDGLVDVVDLYPTLFDACGIEMPNADKIDGVSQWPQITGVSDKPARNAIYHWFNMNDILPRTERLRIYAFDADFKRYAPDSRYPKGRFFDRRSDPEEVAGERGEALGWGHYFHAGLDLDKLTDEQRKAWDELGKVLEAKKEVPVTALAIKAEKNELKVGEKTTLGTAIKPTNATRNNVVWVSSNPEVARIDKFGEITALKPGEVEIRVFSWQDARPLANGKKPEFKTDGIQAMHRLKITD
ncbi:MAG: sulfatase-like hydrolase/transferase [Verrucomicrobiota bacterium]